MLLAVYTSACRAGSDKRQADCAGTHFDLVEALVFTRPGQVDFNIINGNFIVKEGKMLTVDVPVSSQNR